MAELHYFPMLVSDWLSGEATTTMTPEQEGAFLRLLCHAWQSRDVPCSLPDDDLALAELSRLRGRWKKVGPLIKAQFRPLSGSPGRLRNRKQWAVYEVALEKHEKRVRAGGEGGKATAKRKQSSSNAPPLVQQSSSSAGSKTVAGHAAAIGYQPKPKPKTEPEESKDLTTPPPPPPRDLPAEFHSDYEKLLSTVPDTRAWAAEIGAAGSGMHGPVRTPLQVGQAIRDYIANGAAENPNLRQFRAYLAGTVPLTRSPAAAKTTQQERNTQVLDDWLAGKEATSG